MYKNVNVQKKLNNIFFWGGGRGNKYISVYLLIPTDQHADFMGI